MLPWHRGTQAVESELGRQGVLNRPYLGQHSAADVPPITNGDRGSERTPTVPDFQPSALPVGSTYSAVSFRDSDSGTSAGQLDSGMTLALLRETCAPGTGAFRVVPSDAGQGTFIATRFHHRRLRNERSQGVRRMIVERVARSV